MHSPQLGPYRITSIKWYHLFTTHSRIPIVLGIKSKFLPDPTSLAWSGPCCPSVSSPPPHWYPNLSLLSSPHTGWPPSCCKPFSNTVPLAGMPFSYSTLGQFLYLIHGPAFGCHLHRKTFPYAQHTHTHTQSSFNPLSFFTVAMYQICNMGLGLFVYILIVWLSH